jgi:hypothetical protein
VKLQALHLRLLYLLLNPSAGGTHTCWPSSMANHIIADIWSAAGDVMRTAIDLGCYHEQSTSKFAKAFDPLTIDLRRRNFWV